MPSYQIARAIKWPFGDDSIGIPGAYARKAEQVLSRSFVDVDGLIAVHSLLHAFGNRFGIPAHGFSRLCRALADFVRIVLADATAQAENEQNRWDQKGSRKSEHTHENLMRNRQPSVGSSGGCAVTMRWIRRGSDGQFPTFVLHLFVCPMLELFEERGFDHGEAQSDTALVADPYNARFGMKSNVDVR